MSRRDEDGAEPTRAELDEGISRIGHQLDLLRAGPTLGEPSNDGGLIVELQAELEMLRRERRARFG